MSETTANVVLVLLCAAVIWLGTVGVSEYAKAKREARAAQIEIAFLQGTASGLAEKLVECEMRRELARIKRP